MPKFTLRPRLYAAGLASVGLILIAQVRAQNAAEQPAPSKLVAAAESAFKAAQVMYDVGQVDAEELYRWSRRLLDAQLRAGAGNDAALEHVARMRNLHDRIQILNRAGAGGGENLWLHATAWYLEEAQLLALERAAP
jgi:hypothetical protein